MGRMGVTMGGFRRIVIALADILAIIFIVLFTIGGGLSAAASSQMLGGGGGAGTMILGFVLGALGGFLVAAVLAAFLFSLSEIAANTRQTC